MSPFERNTVDAAPAPGSSLSLTDAVMDRVGHFNKVTVEALSIADTIRGKLFGHSGVGESGAKNAPEPVPSCFADAFGIEGERLSRRLNELDTLLREINSKL